MTKVFNLFKRVFTSKVLFWFFILTTILILVLNDVLGDEDSFLISSLIFFCVMGILGIRWLFSQIRYLLRLKKEKKETELLHLKSQVNPHFFFNTLNNLYGLVGQDTVKAQQLILKLSEMMRYSIYEGQNDWVSLEEEVTYLKNYIELHQMRYHKNIDIKFITDIEDPSTKVMPLLFIILLENAFKHGVENLISDAFVHINLSATKNAIVLTVRNNFDVDTLSKNPGIGLKNLKRRLELVYLNKYEYNSTSTDQIYEVKLKLKVK